MHRTPKDQILKTLLSNTDILLINVIYTVGPLTTICSFANADRHVL